MRLWAKLSKFWGKKEMFVMNAYVRKGILITLDTILVSSAFLAAYLLRFDGHLGTYWLQFLDSVFYLITLYIGSNMLFGLYRKMWRYASIPELLGIFWSSVVAGFLSYILFWGLGLNIPRSVLLLTVILSIFFIAGTRFTYRIVRVNQTLSKNKLENNKKRTLIVGAGDAGSSLIKELIQNGQSIYKPTAIVDDADWKQHTSIHNVPIKGKLSDLELICEKEDLEQIIIAMPSVSKSRLKEITQLAQNTKLPIKTLPNINDLLNGKIQLNQLRDIDITDLLGRDEVQLDVSGIQQFVEDQVVLVTGGGGSIGSEICRQVIPFKPKQLLILDNYENNAYDLQQELKYAYPELNLKVVIANIRDQVRMDEVFSTYLPNIVFHAAAHKHVPFMEDDPQESIKNNIFGTLNVAECAHKYKSHKFILISTDKAVNPTNIMGATKRVAELIIQSLDKESQTDFVAVRFGNVLGSNGSVIPLFKKQIEHGGPITLTHPDITRYFMSIPEASRLVIQAGAMAQGGEIYVLDMGEPVKIMDLAKQLIQLSGLEPHKDIKIDIIGLRPGEKLYEELLLEEEGLESTKQDGIFIAKPSEYSFKDITNILAKLDKTNTQNIEVMSQLVPSMKMHHE